jgi:secreted trypsin-like serine protease
MFKILNGTCASYGSYPWTAQIQVKSGLNKFKHHCGATIISEDFLLSAAHCFM